MSLSAHDRNALAWIEGEITESDPKLATMLAAFTALTIGEDMPGPETIRAGPLRASFWRRRGTRPQHRRDSRRGSS